jgi:hypothetical protein
VIIIRLHISWLLKTKTKIKNDNRLNLIYREEDALLRRLFLVLCFKRQNLRLAPSTHLHERASELHIT